MAWVLALALLVWLTRVVERHVRSDDFYTLAAVIKATSIAALISVCVLVFISLTEPRRNRILAGQIALAVVVSTAGLKVGLGYVHLCAAGSRLIEGFAIFGTPIVAATTALFFRHRWAGIAVAILILTAVWLLRRPYLDWTHGN